MLTLTVTIEGRTDGDLELALEAVTDSIQRGNTSGFDSNESGRYTFDIAGEAEKEDDLACAECGNPMVVLDDGTTRHLIPESHGTDDWDHDMDEDHAARMDDEEMKHDPIPSDYPVQPLEYGEEVERKTTCGHCGLSWDDGKVTSMTPTSGGRCPFEVFHIYR
jgi:5-methylcytosine-specific restriction endonuclease McrA